MTDYNDVMLELNEDEATKLLATQTLGRLVERVGQRIEIFPINFVSDGRRLVFRTAPGTKLAGLVAADEIVLETDHVGEKSAWSVVVRGKARILEGEADIAEAEARPAAARADREARLRRDRRRRDHRSPLRARARARGRARDRRVSGRRPDGAPAEEVGASVVGPEAAGGGDARAEAGAPGAGPAVGQVAEAVTGASAGVALTAAELPVPDAVAAIFADDPVVEVVLREALVTGDDPARLPEVVAIVDADAPFAAAVRPLGAVDVRAFSDASLEPLEGAAMHGLDGALLDGATLVVGRLPKSLAELEAIADAVARFAAPEVRLILGARQQHLVRSMNEALAGSFAAVRASRGLRKARALVATEPRPGAPLVRAARIPELDLEVRAVGGAFAGAALDVGTRALLDALGAAASRYARPGDGWRPEEAPGVVVDLGSGTGVLAAWAKRQWPEARVIATDRSWFACESTQATSAANGLDIEVVRADAADALADGSVDLVLCNPPFHDGRGVDRGMSNRLFDAAARVLRPGGALVTVFNSHLKHREQLQARVGHTRQLLRNAKFTVTLSERR